MTVYLTGYCTGGELKYIKTVLGILGHEYIDNTVQGLDLWVDYNRTDNLKCYLPDRIRSLASCDTFWVSECHSENIEYCNMLDIETDIMKKLKINKISEKDLLMDIARKTVQEKLY